MTLRGENSTQIRVFLFVTKKKKKRNHSNTTFSVEPNKTWKFISFLKNIFCHQKVCLFYCVKHPALQGAFLWLGAAFIEHSCISGGSQQAMASTVISPAWLSLKAWREDLCLPSVTHSSSDSSGHTVITFA